MGVATRVCSALAVPIGALLTSALCTAAHADDRWSETFIGGSDADGAVAIAKVPGEEAWILVGSTDSDDFPVTANAFKATRTERFSPDGVILATGPEGFAMKVVRKTPPAFVDVLPRTSWLPLRMDIVWASFLGEYVLPRDVAVDAQGHVLIAGLYGLPYERPSLEPIGDLPVDASSFDSTFNGRKDGFLLELSPDGSEALHATVIGGNDSDELVAVDVGPEGAVYVAGFTTSPNFLADAGGVTVRRIGLPSPPLLGESEGFAMKFNARRALEYGTLFGGSVAEFVSDLAVDSHGRAYIVGSTFSKPFAHDHRFPTTAGVVQPDPPFQMVENARPDSDAFVVRLEADGALSYSTLLAGSEYDAALAVSLAPATLDESVTGPRLTDVVYVAGYTSSPDLLERTTNLSGFSDLFVVALCCGGQTALFSKVLGGAGHEQPTGIDVNGGLEVSVVGWTQSTAFPLTEGAIDTRITSPDARGEVRVEDGPTASREPFALRLSRDTHDVVYSTFLGGSHQFRDEAAAMVSFSDGSTWRALVVGRVRSSDFPASGSPYRRGLPREADVFVVDLPMSPSP